MKANKIERKRKISIRIIGAMIFLALVAAGVCVAYAKLRDLWQSQCAVADVVAQAHCNDGVMVKGDTILERFGIRRGVNLAQIDFDAKRREILHDIPGIRSISVTRLLPDRVEISVEERRPIVRMGVQAQKGITGRVADAEGVVFTCRRGTSMLPIIRERPTAITAVGDSLSGRSLAALRLIEITQDADFSQLGVLDADVAKQDFILVTLGNYAQAKIAWEGMDEPTPSTRASLVRQLTLLRDAIRSSAGIEAKVWNVTIPNRVFANTEENIL